MTFQISVVWGDTFIETFSTGRIKSYLNEQTESSSSSGTSEKPQSLPDHLQSIQLPSECYLFNVREFKGHNVTATYAKQKIVRKGGGGGEGEGVVVEQPMSPRLFPTQETSTPVHPNIYIIPDLKTNTFHDLRLSYSSSTPAQFGMEVFNIQKFETYFPESLSRCCKACQHLKPENTLIIIIYANYDGVSVNEPTSNTLIIPYNIVFEPYLLYLLPRNVLPLLGFMALLSFGIVKIVLPLVQGHLRQIKQE